MRKVLVIIGSTGSGKTKLSIDLAKALDGEIVNSDALQMYRGLDIATAKITESEKCNIRHHLLDTIKPAERCDVHHFKRLALQSIDDILARNKVPIIVGGTMYYTQSILWDSQLLGDQSTDSSKNPAALEYLENLDAKETYEVLQRIDPDMARRLHENNTRRVRRAIEIFYETGKKQSDLIAAQEDSQAHVVNLFDACALWVHCHPDVLVPRLEQRVDKMLQSGLIEEMRELHNVLLTNNDSCTGETCKRDGITQAIGYKEFLPFLNICDADRTDEEKIEVLRRCTEQLNIATRQYARRQLAWIRNRFVTRNVPVYQLDSTDINLWEDRVRMPALRIAKDFLHGNDTLNIESIQVSNNLSVRKQRIEGKFTLHVCDICCGRKFIGDVQWEEHMRSKKHQKRTRGLKKLIQKLHSLDN